MVRRKWKFYGVAIAVAVAIAGCGGSSSTTPTTSSTAAAGSPPAGTVASIAKLVPAALKAKGTLVSAEDESYAPDEFVNSNGQTVGMDIDLLNALAKVMGLKFQYQNIGFDSIIPGLIAGRYDLSASSMNDTLPREKTIEFVDYANVGETFFTKASGGVNIGSIADICGMSVSLESGTTEFDDATTQSKKCVAEGKKPVTVMPFQNQNLANEALASDRSQLSFADTPVALYQVAKSDGKFTAVGTAYAAAPYGIAMLKQNGLAPAVRAALLYLQKNGTYMKIVKKWGVQSIAIPASKMFIDGATS